MKDFLAYASLVVMTVAAAWYCRMIVTKRVSPAPATWAVGCFATNLSWWGYWNKPGATIWGNVSLFGGVFQVTTVSAVLFVSLWKEKALRLSFDRVQRTCLGVAGAVLVFWVLNPTSVRAAQITFWTTQALLVVAYAATIGKALALRKNVDSIFYMVGVSTSAVLGLFPPVWESNVYGITSSVRFIVSAILTTCLLCALDRKQGWVQLKREIDAVPFWIRDWARSLFA